MKPSRFTTLMGGMLVLLAVGCAGVQPTPKAPVVDPAPYLAKAQAAEASGDIQKAMAYLDLAEAVNPGDPQTVAQRARVEAVSKTRAAQHFERGQANFTKGKHRAAQREFMAVLRYEPNHAGAMDYLKNKLSQPSATQYRVVKGDSLKGIADKIYRDPEKAFLIAFFNDLKPGSEPQPGTTLVIPRLKGMAVAAAPKEKTKKAPGTEPGKPKAEAAELANADKAAEKKTAPETPLLTVYEDKKPSVNQGPEVDDMVLTIYEDKESETLKELNQAKTLMAKRDYDRVIPLARLILEKDPANEDAADLINAAFYQKGLEMDKQHKYIESLEMYEEVEPGYRDVDTRITQVKETMRKQAEQYYRQGVNDYVNENLAGAIDAWEKTLTLDPDHAKAAQDIEKARLLLKKLQAIQ